MRKNATEVAFLVHDEEDMEILTLMLFRKKKRCYVIPQRYDVLNVSYYVVTDVLKTPEITKTLQDYKRAGGFEEPIIKFR